MNWLKQSVKPTLPKVKANLPFAARAAKNNNVIDTTMKVVEVGANIYNGHDFSFVGKLIETLRTLPYEQGVFFPKIEGGLTRAEVKCVYEYSSCRPCGTLTFYSERLGMVMKYSARVSLTVSRQVIEQTSTSNSCYNPSQLCLRSKSDF